MLDDIIGQEQATGILEPYLEVLGTCLWRAWETWKATPLPVAVSARTRANLVYDYAAEEAWKSLRYVEGLELTDAKGFLLICVEQRLLLRIKKFRGNLKTSGIATNQQLEFAFQQLTIPGLPPMTNLVIGYLLDDFQLEINRVAITCSVGNRVIWTTDVPRPGAATVVPLRPAPVNPIPPRVRSTRRREESGEQEA